MTEERNTSSAAETPPRGGKGRFAGLKWLGRTAVNAAVLAAVIVGGIALVGVAQRQGWIQAGAGDMGDAGHVGHDHAADSTYTCPMHPQIRQNGPGDCPICGMDLVPVAAEAQPAPAADEGDDRYICPMMCVPPTGEPGRCPVCGMELVPATSGGGGDGMSVSIEPAARRLVGIQTATAEVGPAEQTIRTVGSIDYDESKLATISAWTAGRIEKLYANYVGVPMNKGDDLALVYSPDLYSAQVEYLTALKGGQLQRLGGRTNLAELAKQNLTELGLSDSQIDALRQRGKAESRIRITAPIGGTVIDKYAVEGDYLKTGDKIYRIADLSTVWLMLDLYPDDATRIRFGQEVQAEVSSMPGEVFTGRVAFIDPTVDPKTRTVQVRVEMLNASGKLRPGDYATARIAVPAVPQTLVYDPVLSGKFISPMHPQIIRDQPGDCPICDMDLIPTSQLGYADTPQPEQQVVTVPRDAVLMTGDSSVIYVETEPGRFEIRRVTVGPLTDDEAVILEGLAAGETVATQGNFLIDSQMQLAGNPSLMDPSKATMYPPGPLELPPSEPMLLAGDAGEQFDRAYQAYFTIQETLAADRTPPPVAVNTLDDALGQLVGMADVPDDAQRHLQRAKRATPRLGGSLEEAREGFRPLSHAMLKAATFARGNQTAEKLVHYHCSMVPGNGGDWLQPGGKLFNPYWGDEMLHCGEVVGNLATSSADLSAATGDDR